MEQSPSWEANSHSAFQEIPSAPLIPVLSQMHPVHISPHYFPKMNSYIILPSTPTSSEWSLPFRFSNQNFVWISPLSHACYISCPLIILNLIALIMFCEVYKLWSSSLCSLLQTPAPSSLLGPNFLLCTLFLDTHNLCSSLSVRDQVSHPYKTTGKIMFFIYFNL